MRKITKKKIKDEPKVKRKAWLVNKVSERASFLKSDVKIIIGAIEDVIQELADEEHTKIIREGRTETSREFFHWHGLFSLRLTKFPGHKAYDPYRKEHYDRKDIYRVTIRPSLSFVSLANKKDSAKGTFKGFEDKRDSQI